MWGLVVVLTLSVLTAMARVSHSVVLVVLHDMLPVNLVVAWAILVVGLVTREWVLAVTAALLVGYHVGLLATRHRVDDAPAWAASAPRLRVTVANVYIGNARPKLR